MLHGNRGFWGLGYGRAELQLVLCQLGIKALNGVDGLAASKTIEATLFGVAAGWHGDEESGSGSRHGGTGAGLPALELLSASLALAGQPSRCAGEPYRESN